MRLNILMIMTDQQHKYALGSVLPYVHTPNLDRLAAGGTRFTNAYSNNPVCGPYRGLLYTGTYTRCNRVIRNGNAIAPGEICLADELKKAGYETSFVGKLHLGANGADPVLPEYRAGHEHFIGYQCYNGFYDNVFFYDEACNKHLYDRHRTDVTTDLGIERLRMLARKKKPFYQTIFYQAPHYPEEPAPEYERLYDGVEFPLPEAYQEIDPYTPTFSPYSPRPIEKCRNYQRYGNNIQLYLKLYYAMVSQIDANVGRILEELERLGIAEETAILFSSDHGDMQGSHGLKNKCLPYERSCGIPLIVSIPGMEQKRTVDTPVSAIDYYPTCMDIADVQSEKRLYGESLLPLLRGETDTHGEIYAENYQGDFRWTMVRDARYKLVYDTGKDESVLLFDMERDPQEIENLVENPAYQSVREMLEEKIARFHHLGCEE